MLKGQHKRLVKAPKERSQAPQSHDLEGQFAQLEAQQQANNVGNVSQSYPGDTIADSSALDNSDTGQTDGNDSQTV